MKTFLKAQWQNLIMANYAIDASYLMPYLPAGVELDTFEGKTYVSLVGFLFKDTKLFNLPIPFLGTFEEVNLRFYVVRKVGNEMRRGVVFINETVPNKTVAWVANKLYKEHYTAIPTKHKWTEEGALKTIRYDWQVQSVWNHLQVTAQAAATPMQACSIEAFIFEHYYGYTKVNAAQSSEYKVNHPSWNIHAIEQYEINCDFEKFYGPDFKILNTAKPHSIMLAEGSAISVDWKRIQF
jgi:uncharacterized protein YqjF (DUF2071 family)